MLDIVVDQASGQLGLPAGQQVHEGKGEVVDQVDADGEIRDEARAVYIHRHIDALRAAVTVPFVLPTVAVGVAFGALLREDGWLGWLGLDGTPVAIVAAMVFFNYSVVVRTVGAMWARLDPRLAQAGATLGAGPLRVFLTVTLPTLAPAVLSAAAPLQL